MTERMKNGLDTLTVPFRFILPILMGLFIYNYNGDQTRLRQDIVEIKESQGKIWNSISTNSNHTQGQLNYVYQQCCKGATSPPPIVGQ